MKPYANKSHDAGVSAYENGDHFIIVKFAEDGEYLYDYRRPGRAHVTKMKALAEAGDGLTTYINQYVREDYAKKLR